MDECVAEDVDQILNPDDYVDDTGDDGSRRLAAEFGHTLFGSPG